MSIEMWTAIFRKPTQYYSFYEGNWTQIGTSRHFEISCIWTSEQEIKDRLKIPACWGEARGDHSAGEEELAAEIHSKVGRGSPVTIKGCPTAPEPQVQSRPVVATSIKHRPAFTQQIRSDEASPRWSQKVGVEVQDQRQDQGGTRWGRVMAAKQPKCSSGGDQVQELQLQSSSLGKERDTLLRLFQVLLHSSSPWWSSWAWPSKLLDWGPCAPYPEHSYYLVAHCCRIPNEGTGIYPELLDANEHPGSILTPCCGKTWCASAPFLHAGLLLNGHQHTGCRWITMHY